MDLSTLTTCDRCALCATRTQVVVGDGRTDAPILFVGEAPGRTEDEGGRPFIGAAGKILDEFLAIAGLTRADLYITNVVKCRPPQNRNPRPEEIVACAPWLRVQIAAQRPQLIVALGAFAAHFLLDSEAPMAALEGRIRTTTVTTPAGPCTCEVLPVYHPAATIYNRSLRTPFFEAAHRIAERRIAS